MAYRIHILGAAGAGTTSLGRALAERLNVAYFDSDDFYWQQTSEPFTVARLRDERTRLLLEQSSGLEGWVVSGSLCGWGDAMIPQFTHVVFLRVDPQIRLNRLRRREVQRYGERILPGAAATKTAWLSSPGPPVTMTATTAYAACVGMKAG